MTTLPTLGSGIPVPTGQIARKLKELWEESGAVATRASLMNLALYCEGRETMERNTALIGQITLAHACRGILICAEPDAPETHVEAWISAHCHLGRAGKKQVCCEQITFLLQGPSRDLIPSIVFSHLDSDLPLCLWWRAEFPQPIDRRLWNWVDRLIFDSNDWDKRLQQLKLLKESLADTQRLIILCDLNWTRSVYFRQALSATFDNPVHLPQLPLLEEITITHAPGFASTARLIIGWMASRLEWRSVGRDEEGRFRFVSSEGKAIRASLVVEEGAPISRCQLKSSGGAFELTREEGSDFLHASVVLDDGHTLSSLLPGGADDEASLVNEEICRGGRNLVYLKAVDIAETI